jgi:hypothetical protein
MGFIARQAQRKAQAQVDQTDEQHQPSQALTNRKRDQQGVFES